MITEDHGGITELEDLLEFLQDQNRVRESTLVDLEPLRGETAAFPGES